MFTLSEEVVFSKSLTGAIKNLDNFEGCSMKRV